MEIVGFIQPKAYQATETQRNPRAGYALDIALTQCKTHPD